MLTQQDLAHFTGSEEYYRHFTGLIFTEGIQFLAENAGCYWLIDLVASYQRDPRVKAVAEFQLWSMTLNKTGRGGVATMREDSDKPVIIRQRIPYTDFPLKSFEFYVCNGTMMLKGEY